MLFRSDFSGDPRLSKKTAGRSEIIEIKSLLNLDIQEREEKIKEIKDMLNNEGRGNCATGTCKV